MERIILEYISQLTIEEKLQFLTIHSPCIERLGLPEFYFGGEAAHGVEARHDQMPFLSEAHTTTVFTQPIGMSSSFDRECIRQVGEVIGTEARALHQKNGFEGLSRWTPTVDLCRDPRWGRTEEGYGEDPYLIGEMASSFINGMQGEDPFFIRCAATLKHFYANNKEEDREKCSSDIDEKDKFYYYLEPFRKAVKKGGAISIMTAYNEINRIPAIVNPEINQIVRGEWGLEGHVVGDMGDLSQLVTHHHYCQTPEEALAHALKAGIDLFNDPEEFVVEAAEKALKKKLISVQDIDRALYHTFLTKVRLGIYKTDSVCPYRMIGADQINTEAHKKIALQMAQKSIVLLKNENKILPLKSGQTETIAVVGPLADVWTKDWYSGIPQTIITPLQGIRETFWNAQIIFHDSSDIVHPMYHDHYLCVRPNGECYYSKKLEEAESFRHIVWEEDRNTFYAISIGKYLRRDTTDRMLYADHDELFSWYIEEAFSSDEFIIILLNDGIKTAAELSKNVKTVIAVAGCHPIVSCKEGIDRKSLQLPLKQSALLKAVRAVNENLILVLITNYPYAIQWEHKMIPAILQTASGAQHIGKAIASCIAGEFSPAGRLPMTWYASEKDLPDMSDYAIRNQNRTYRYFKGEVLFPFGHGLSYSEFEYSNETYILNDNILTCYKTVKNIGDFDSDIVVLFFYRTALVGFERVFLKIGEERIVKIINNEMDHIILANL